MTMNACELRPARNLGSAGEYVWGRDQSDRAWRTVSFCNSRISKSRICAWIVTVARRFSSARPGRSAPADGRGEPPIAITRPDAAWPPTIDGGYSRAAAPPRGSWTRPQHLHRLLGVGGGGGLRYALMQPPRPRRSGGADCSAPVERGPIGSGKNHRNGCVGHEKSRISDSSSCKTFFFFLSYPPRVIERDGGGGGGGWGSLRGDGTKGA